MKCRCRKRQDSTPKPTPSVVIVGTPPPLPANAIVPIAVHTDIALTSLFNAHVSLINSERTTIWQRYSVSLAGNALLVAFMGGKSQILVIIMSGFGFVFAVCSIVMLERGYNLFLKRLVQAGRFKWQTAENVNPIGAPHHPEAGHEEARQNVARLRTRDVIRCCARIILYGFATLYLAIGVIAIRWPDVLRKVQCECASGQATIDPRLRSNE